MRGAVIGPLTIACVGAVALSGCSGSSNSNSGSTAAAQLVLRDGPSGYNVLLDHSISAEDMAAATSSNPGALARTLALSGYRGGYERVWTSGGAYLSVVVAETSTAFGAVQLAQFQAQQLSAGRGVVPYADNDIPGGRAFDFFGTTRQGGLQVFCEGVVFSVEADVFLLNDCSQAPRPADRVLAAARAEYVLAATRLGVPVATPAA